MFGNYAVRVADEDAAPAPTAVSAESAGPTSLLVRWTATTNAQQGFVVQWCRAGEAWSASRQLTLAESAWSARIDGLTMGVQYQVRVLGLNRGDASEPSAEARGVPAPLG